ncbi:hypothetical protein AB0D94_08190 [Streptomyces sp. NPDC048255]|uniref:hypothetical protein n=1 Tax=Streptomyces sp. NPDC048255 TaxID=3154713 RepID=UPI0033F9D06C
MPDAFTPEPTTESAYALDLEMSLLLAASAPAPWLAAVTESARILAGRPWTQGSLAPGELCTLALLLYARTYTGERLPHEVPVEELREALDEPLDREPRIVDEIDDALTATGQVRDVRSAEETAPLRRIFDAAKDRYIAYAGMSMAALDVEPPVPGPSPMRRAAQRLAEFLTDYTPLERQGAAAPLVESGPLLVEATTIRIVTSGSVMPLQCPRRSEDGVGVVRVDGPVATFECEQGHVSQDWRLSPAHVRLAVARATGVRPSVQGTCRVEDLLIMAASMPRHSDPLQSVFFRAAQTELVGQEGVIGRIRRLISG